MVLDQFSGALCVDELHLGRFVLLLATDPIRDLPVAFALVGANDHDHMRRFLGNLKNWGLVPRAVITDGSNLYPAVLEELWPDADHQVCGRPRTSGDPRSDIRPARTPPSRVTLWWCSARSVESSGRMRKSG